MPRHAFSVADGRAKSVAQAFPKNTKLSVIRTPYSGMD